MLRINILETKFSYSETTLLINYLMNPNLKHKSNESKCWAWKKHVELKRYLTK